MRTTTIHRDGTVSYWSVYEQTRVIRAHTVPDREIAAMGPRERARVIRALAEAKPELYQALSELVAAIKSIECWEDDCPYLVPPMEKARRALAAAHA